MKVLDMEVRIKIKNLLKYIFIFMLILVILLLLLVLTAKIPKTLLNENYIESTSYFIYPKYLVLGKEIDAIDINRTDTYKHIYADAMIMNIMYCIDSNNPLKSVMEAKYYSIWKNKDISYDFERMVENNQNGNTQYMRYWHGSMSILRPLFVFFNIEQIYCINMFIILALAIILLIMLIRTKIKELVVAYIIGLIMCTIVTVPLCLEYVWTFIIMFIVSIISIIQQKKNKDLNILFLISGMLTCYLDFLSTEIITCLVPLLIIITIMYKKGKITNFKECLKTVIILITFWGIGYVGMWISKWILASIILNVNALDYVKYDILNRIAPSSFPKLSIKAIKANFFTLFPVNIIENKNILIILLICILIIQIIFMKKDIKKQWFSVILLLISIIPYIRYAFLASHSYTHFFFTYRSQIVTVMGVILAIIYSIDWRKAKTKIKLWKKR